MSVGVTELTIFRLKLITFGDARHCFYVNCQVTYYDQFVLSKEPFKVVQDWSTHELGGFLLQAHPNLPVIAITDEDRIQVGFLVGWPIIDLELIEGHLKLPYPAFELERRLEGSLREMGGRFAMILIHPEMQRVYPDVAASLSMVYAMGQSKLGSTVSLLLLNSPDHPVWSKGLDDFPCGKANQFYPFGLTAAPEIRRLIPNHYLDLQKWSSVRFAPIHSVPRIDDHEVPDFVDRIANRLSKQITALTKRYPAYISLTAGNDSRMVLACAKDVMSRVTCVTLDRRRRVHGVKQLIGGYFVRRQRNIDVFIARKLADKFQLRHKLIGVSSTDEATRMKYVQQIGWSGATAKASYFYQSCRKHLDMDYVWLTGHIPGFNGRLYWQQGDQDAAMISSSQLLERMSVRLTPEFTEACEAWMKSLPPLTLLELLDLAYLESRAGCWATPHFYGTAPFRINISPFCHYEIFDLMFRLPFKYRFDKRLAVDIVALKWPEAGRVPINRFSGLNVLMDYGLLGLHYIGKYISPKKSPG